MSKNEKILTEDAIRGRMDAISTRLISNNNQSFERSVTKKGNGNIGFSALSAHSHQVANEMVSNQVILESNPHMNRAIEILVGLITCPSGGSKVVLNYEATVTSGDEKYNKDASAVVAVIEDHFNNVVKLPLQVADMVYKSLATDGAHVTVIIPDSNINRLLDENGLESEVKRYDFGAMAKDGKETAINGFVSVTNDINVLRLSENKRALAEYGTSEIGNESEQNKKASQLAVKVMRRRRLFKKTSMQRIEETDTSAEIYAPIKVEWPAQACRPIIFKNEPDEPYGHILILDEDGYAVETNEEIDFDKDLRSMAGSNTEEQQIRKIANNFTRSKQTPVNSLQHLQEEFNSLLEGEVYKSMCNGEYAEKYTIRDDNLISQIMFHRLLKNQKTRLLFIPDRLVSYFAFDVDKYGVGRSLISRTKALSNIYTVMFYANFLGSLSSAINHKEVSVTFDEDDPDMNKSLEKAINELIMSSVGSFDFNFNGPSDVIRNIQKHGMSFKLNNVQQGDLPNMNIEVNDRKREHTPINSDFFNQVAKLLSMRIGFSPELIDSSYAPEFSSQVIRDNEITARHLSKYSDRAGEKLTDRVVKETLADPTVFNKCLEAISGAEVSKEERLVEILSNLNVYLPINDSAAITARTELIEDNLKAIRLIVETLFPDSLTEGVENMSRNHLDSIRELATTYFMSDYIRTNSSFKAIVDRVRTADGLKAILDGESDFKVEMMGILAEYTKKIMDADEKIEDKFRDDATSSQEDSDNYSDTSGDEVPVIEEDETSGSEGDDVPVIEEEEETGGSDDGDDLGIPTI